MFLLRAVLNDSNHLQDTTVDPRVPVSLLSNILKMLGMPSINLMVTIGKVVC